MVLDIRKVMNKVRAWAAKAVKFVLGVTAVLVVVLQVRDFKGGGEVFPVSGFVVFMTFASFASGVARSCPEGSSMGLRAKQTSFDLFVASALMLTSAALQTTAHELILHNTLIVDTILSFHVISLAIGLGVGWIAFSTLLDLATKPVTNQRSEGT
jgi:hypothetical protein